MSSSDDDAHTDTSGTAPHGGRRAPVRSLQDSLQVRIDQGDGRTVVAVTGEIDYDSAPLLQRALDQVLRSCGSRLEVDLAGVGFCDCAGLDVLLHTRCLARDAQVTLTLAGVGTAVQRLLELTDTRPLFTLTAPAPRAGSAAGGYLALMVGLHGSAGSPRRLLVQFDDGRQVVTEYLTLQESWEIARAVRGRMAPRTCSEPTPVRWLAHPLPVRVARTAGPGPLLGARFTALASVDHDSPGEPQGVGEQS
jgi:anti-anti-sigma factor